MKFDSGAGLRRIFLISFTLLSVLSILNFVFANKNIETETKIGASINLSGKQRMLSQKILAYSNLLFVDYNKSKTILLESANELSVINNELINGSDRVISALELNDKFKDVYFSQNAAMQPHNLKARIEDYSNAAKRLAATSPYALSLDDTDFLYIQHNSQQLLDSLQESVKMYQDVGNANAKHRQFMEIIVTIIFIAALMFIAFIIIIPALKRISEREKQLENERSFANMIIESNKNAIIAIDQNSNVVIYNKAAEDMFGYTKQEMLGSDTLSSIIPGEFFAMHDAASKKYLKTGQSNGTITATPKLKGKTKSGDTIDILISFGVGEYNKKPIVVANLQDITQDVQKLETINTLNSKLSDALMAQKRFLASMSHEIRTPLNSIIGFLNLVKNSPHSNENEKTEWIKNASVSSNHLLSLVNDILDASKIDAGQLELANREMDICALLNDCLTIIASRIENGVALEQNIAQFNETLLGDEVRIRQIIINLLGNAAKFTHQGFVKLTMQEPTIEGEFVSLRIIISDSGIGIPGDKISELFGAFKQVVNSDSGGTGLGLYISNKLAVMMGGQISVTSEIGIGSNFIVDIKLQKTGKSLSEHVTKQTCLEFDMSTFNILLVDDVKTNILLAKAVFSKFFNIDIDTAQSGQEAIDKINEKHYDAVFMDIQMPQMSGLEATRKIREFNQKIAIIAMTANAFAQDKQEALDAGMNDFVSKPISPDAIRQAVINCLRK